MKSLRRLFLPGFLLLAAALALPGCGRDRDTVRKVDLLMEVGDIDKAYGLLQASLIGEPNSRTLRRAEIRLLLRAERVDLAFLRYQDLVRQVSRGDGILLEALRDKNETVRVSAARALDLVGDPSVVSPLLKALSDKCPEVRRAAAVSLGDLKDRRAVGPLLGALQDPEWTVRADSAAALGRLRDPRAVAPLFGLLGDGEGAVRRAAENALTTIAKEAADPAPFVMALASPDPAVVHAAAFSLVAARNKAATPVLLTYLASSEPIVRQQGLRGFRYLVDPAALPQIRAALSDSDATVRQEAVLAVVDYRDKEAIGALRALASDPREEAKLRALANEAAARLAALP